jgi:hypothetical protein
MLQKISCSNTIPARREKDRYHSECRDDAPSTHRTVSKVIAESDARRAMVAREPHHGVRPFGERWRAPDDNRL